MDDTDRMLLPTTPFVRPTTAEAFDDPTPTTAPSWMPRRRLARGTMAPPVDLTRPSSKPTARTARRPSLDTPPGLPIMLVESPRRWGFVVRVDLEPPVAPVVGEVTLPVRRVGRTIAAGPIVAGAAALAVVVGLAFVLARRDPSPAPVAAVAQAEPVAAVAPVAQVVEPVAQAEPLPLPPPSAPIVTPIVIALEPAPPVAAPVTPPAETYATLMIGSKPPCRIFVDGQDTGLTTPQRDVRVRAGRRTITLRNDELGVEHSSTVNVIGGRKAKLIRDLTAQLAE